MNTETANVSALVEHLLVRFHEPAYEDFDEITRLLDKVTRAHGHQDPARFEAIDRTWTALRDGLVPHFRREEMVLFPMLLRLAHSGALTTHGTAAAVPLRGLRDEHAAARRELALLRDLCDDYDMPPEAFASWRALYVKLLVFERDLLEHFRIEDESLFNHAEGSPDRH